MLIINETDIMQSIRIEELLKSVEEALLVQETGNFYMPDRIHLSYAGNVQLLMPAFAESHFATKLVTVFPGNKKRNKPTIQGTVILNDGETGEPLAVLDGAKLTALRTGAVGALGIAYTTPVALSIIGLIGAGIQGFHQVLFSAAVRNLTQVNVYDPYHKDLDRFVGQLQDYLPTTQVRVCSDASSVLSSSEAIITATTSLKPVLPDDPKLLIGKHFIGIGSYTPDMQEFPETMFGLLDQVLIDTPLAMVESGDVSVPLSKGLTAESDIYTLGKIINGTKQVNLSGTTFFKSVGMALFDLFAARLIYKNALAKQLGQNVKF